jgi:hypothetical protein
MVPMNSKGNRFSWTSHLRWVDRKNPSSRKGILKPSGLSRQKDDHNGFRIMAIVNYTYARDCQWTSWSRPLGKWKMCNIVMSINFMMPEKDAVTVNTIFRYPELLSKNLDRISCRYSYPQVDTWSHLQTVWKLDGSITTRDKILHRNKVLKSRSAITFYQYRVIYAFLESIRKVLDLKEFRETGADEKENPWNHVNS